MSLEYKVFIAMSLDGYIAGINNELDWLTSASNSAEDYGHDSFINTVDAILMGSNTYEVVSKFPEWTYKKPVIVISSKTITLSNAVCFNGALNDVDSYMQQANYQRIYVDGGITISKLIRAEKISSLIITVIPIILGNGIKLFTDLDQSVGLKLSESKTFASGVVQLKYIPDYSKSRV